MSRNSRPRNLRPSQIKLNKSNGKSWGVSLFSGLVGLTAIKAIMTGANSLVSTQVKTGAVPTSTLLVLRIFIVLVIPYETESKTPLQPLDQYNFPIFAFSFERELKLPWNNASRVWESGNGVYHGISWNAPIKRFHFCGGENVCPYLVLVFSFW